MTDATVVEPAPAKINLYLHVTGRRDNGYHLIDSLAAFVAVCDVVRIESAGLLSVSVDGPTARQLDADLGAGNGDNIVLDAARRLAAYAGRAPDIHIRLTKILPIAAGLGGGSSDAAAVLRALCRYWGLDRSRPEIAEIALALGADVPVCLGAVPAWMGGIGDQVTPLPAPCPDLHIVLVNPGARLSTAAVFNARAGGFGPADRLVDITADPEDFVAALAARRNDLEPAARKIEPIIGGVLRELAAAPGCGLARMSGSGATCYGLFVDNGAALAAATHIATSHTDWWVTKCRLIDSLNALKT